MRASWRTPARLVTLAFLLATAVGTGLLLLPASRPAGVAPDLMAAAFTTVSAVCVTGLTTVDTATMWTPFGQTVILLLIHVGGLGVMTLATLLALAVRRRVGLSDTLVAQAESHTPDLGSVRRVIAKVLLVMVVVETAVALVLTARFRLTYHDDWSTAVWHGVFHAGSAFNNAGFALYSDNLIGFVTDPWIILPLCLAVILGGLGFPVLRELRHRWRAPQRWTIHTRLTVWGTLFLLVGGTVAFWLAEATGGDTLFDLDRPGQLVGAVAGGVFPRTAGFNTVDYGEVTEETKGFTTALMFIGGGSAGTAGGVKVTTFLVLAYVIWAEVRGERDVVIGSRRVSTEVQRQALSVALLAVGLVATAIMAMLMLTDLPTLDVVFEVVSAFATVGLSTGITPELPVPAQIVLMLLMFIGRVGTITVASALALNTRPRHYRLPEERPLVG